MADRFRIFVNAKRLMRAHPDWPDERVAADLGVHEFDRHVIAEACRDLQADQASVVHHSAASWEAGP